MNEIINERWEISTDGTEVQRIIRDYCQHLYASELDDLEDVNGFLKTYSLPSQS